MYDKTLIKDDFGQHYTIRAYVNPQIKGDLSPKEFPDTHLARQFVQHLQVPTGYWQGLMHDTGSVGGPMMSEADMVCAICDRIVTGQLKIFPVKPPETGGSAKNRTIQTQQEVYQFATPDTQLLNKIEVLQFNSLTDASALLQKLNPDDQQLRSIAAELNVPITANASSAEISTAIADSLVKGDAVITHNLLTSATPPTAAEAVAAAVVQEAGLGPEDKKVETEEEKKPDCIYKKMTLTCRHGRSVSLDPSKPLEDGKIPVLQVVSCQNQELKDSSGTPIFDNIRVLSEIDDVCGTHKKDFISIGDSEAAIILEQVNGKDSKFNCPSKIIKVGHGSSLLKYLWLPNVEKDGVKKYKVFAKNSCDFSQFEGKVKSIQVEVFPYLKWSLSFNVNLGTIKSAERDKDVKRAFEGSLKLQQDKTEADEFTVDYKKKLEKFEKTLESFKKVLNKNIFERFADGRNFNIDVTLPKITLTYDAEFKEKSGSPLVVRTHELTFEAAPFVAINASVDILPVIVKFLSSWWSSLFNVFFDWIKQQFGEKDGKAHIESNIQFVVSIGGDLGAKFTHKSDENEKTFVEGEPVNSKIKIKAEGEAKLDGHVYVVKVEVVLKAGLESSIDLAMSLGSDEVKKEQTDLKQSDSAPYVSFDFMFNGIKLYLEKEVQLSLTKDTKNIDSDNMGFFEDIVDKTLDEGDEISSKEIERSEPRTWLKMSDKHQFKYYLDKEDEVKVQSEKALKAEAEKKAKHEKQQKFDYQMQAAKEKDEKLMSDLKQRLNSDPPKAL